MRQSDLFIIPRRPWNAGRLIGPKAPLKPKHIWAIRQQLKVAKRVRDLAMFNCALDAKLRACDLIKLRVSDVAPGGLIDLEPAAYGTHSLRRTKVSLVYKKTGNLRACQLLLGHRKLKSTVRYLGIEVDDALELSEQIDL